MGGDVEKSKAKHHGKLAMIYQRPKTARLMDHEIRDCHLT